MYFWKQLQERLAILQTFLTREMFSKSIIHAYQHYWTNFSPLVFRIGKHFPFLLKCIAVWRFLYYLFSDPFIIMSYEFIMISCADVRRIYFTAEAVISSVPHKETLEIAFNGRRCNFWTTLLFQICFWRRGKWFRNIECDFLGSVCVWLATARAHNMGSFSLSTSLLRNK